MIHTSRENERYVALASMLRESLPEYLFIAKQAIGTEKIQGNGDIGGCYGYPAALLLLSITDTIGAYVLGGSVEKHFEILTRPEYFNIGLTKEDTKELYNHYRCMLSHTAIVMEGFAIFMGEETNPVYQEIIALDPGENFKGFNITAFLKATEEALNTFLDDNLEEIIKKSQPYKDYLAKNKAKKK